MYITKTYPKYLGKYIKLFYSVRASKSDCHVNYLHRRLPDGTLDVVFNLGSAIHVSRDSTIFSEMPQVSITGLHPDKNFIVYKGEVNLVGVVFQPGYAHLFVNDTLDNFKECTLNADLIFGKSVYQLLNHINEISDEKERHLLLEKYLHYYIKGKREDYNMDRISNSVRQIHQSEGNVDISNLYKTNYMSERSFRRKFNEYVGMAPKNYATIIRVKSFSKRFETSRGAYIHIINELGYEDQSHFSKDFKKIVGVNPKMYFEQLNIMAEKFIHLI
jgi:AraC-like DNA-binding protein